MKPNSRVHLPGGSVTALAEGHRRLDHRLGLPGPRRTSPAGDANVSFVCGVRDHLLVRIAMALLLISVLVSLSCDKHSTKPTPAQVAGDWNGFVEELSRIPEERHAICSLSFAQYGDAFIGAGFLSFSTVRIDDGHVDGDRVSFTILTGLIRRIEFTGLVADSTMHGQYIVRAHGDSVSTNSWALHRITASHRPVAPRSVEETETSS